MQTECIRFLTNEKIKFVKTKMNISVSFMKDVANITVHISFILSTFLVGLTGAEVCTNWYCWREARSGGTSSV